MVKTRSGKRIGAEPKKIKFLDDGKAPQFSVAPKAPAIQPESEEETDSDEAPEEDSTSQSREAALNKIKERELADLELKRQAKERRKLKDLQFAEQQLAKRRRLQELALAEQLPELLPEELFQKPDTSEPGSKKHVREDELDLQHQRQAEALRKQAKLEKLRKLKELKTSAVQKGAVHVRVLASDNGVRKAPVAEQRVLQSKEDWMHRKSLAKKRSVRF